VVCRIKSDQIDLFPLGLEPGLADAGTPQLHVEDTLHGGEDLLVGDGAAALELGDDRGRRIAPRRQVLLRHLGLHPLPRPADGVADYLTDRVGLDDVVATVDFCEVLAIRSFTDLISRIEC